MKLIAAVTEDYNIICKDSPLFTSKKYMTWFEEQTANSSCIMGYNTFMGLPVNETEKEILPNCKKVVLCYPYQMLSALARGADDITSEANHTFIEQYQDAYVIGGPTCWKLFAPYITEIYLTHFTGEKEELNNFPLVNDFALNDVTKWQSTVLRDLKENVIKYTLI